MSENKRWHKDNGASSEEAHEILGGVTIEFLRIVFRTSRPVVSAKLKGLRPLRYSPTGKPIYDLAEASARLVESKIDLEEYLKDIKDSDLPEKLRETFWNAKLKQQRFEKNAGELWRTEAVIKLFGSVLKDAKERIRLIVTMSETALGLSPSQLHGLREIINDVQGGIHKSIMDLESKTPSSVAELNKEYGAEEDADYESPTVTKDGPKDDFEY